MKKILIYVLIFGLFNNINSMEDQESDILLIELNQAIEQRAADQNSNPHKRLDERLVQIINNFYYYPDQAIRLILKGANPDIKDKYGRTAIILASKMGEIELVKQLIGKANTNIRDDDGQTALMYAASYGYTEIVKLFLAHRADVNIKDNKGRTGLEWATNNGHREIAELLKSYENK